MNKTQIRILQPGDEGALEAFLAPRLSSSMFLVGNMRAVGLLDKGQVFGGTYAAAFEEGKIVGVVAHYWNQNLIFQAPTHLNALWQAAVSASGRPLKGLLGPSQQVKQALEQLGLEDERLQLNKKEKLYRLTLDELIVPEALRSGELSGRRIERRDLDLVTKWRVAYSIETLGQADSPSLHQQARASMERSLKDGHSWLLEAKGKPVALTSFNTTTAKAVQVGGVWTPPELRRRGYARAVVAVSLLDARADSAELAILFTGEENIPAQKAYLALGFEHIGDYQITLLREGE